MCSSAVSEYASNLPLLGGVQRNKGTKIVTRALEVRLQYGLEKASCYSPEPICTVESSNRPKINASVVGEAVVEGPQASVGPIIVLQSPVKSGLLPTFGMTGHSDRTGPRPFCHDRTGPSVRS